MEPPNRPDGIHPRPEATFRNVKADGLAAIDEAIDSSQRAEERWATAEVTRVKGALLLLQGSPESVAAAEDHFRRALDWARRQGSLSWELRAAVSLARLLSDQRRSADVMRHLQPVYDRFTEGFETADLKSAGTLLDALSQSPSACGKRGLTSLRRANGVDLATTLPVGDQWVRDLSGMPSRIAGDGGLVFAWLA